MKKRRSIGQVLIDFRTILILIFLIAIFTYLKPVFINPMNLLNMLKRQSFTMIAAFGMTFLLTLGVFDMSAGSTVALVGIVLAYGLNKGVSAAVMLPAVVILSIVCGLINGIIVVKGKIPAFLTTLATMNIYRGLAQTISDGKTISIKLKWLTNLFGNGTLLGIPTPVIIMLIFLVVAAFLFYKTKLGFYYRCIGGNIEASKVAGINVNLIQIVAFCMMGLAAGAAGLIECGLMNAGMPDLGSDLAMDAIAAAVLGGTAISGGLGTIWGTIGGALIMGILNSGLALMGAQTPVQLFVKGLVIIAAILMDNMLKSRKTVVKA